MSRSYKKPGGTGNYKGAKRRSSKVVRHTVKVILHVWNKENYGAFGTPSEGFIPEDPVIPLRGEIINSYDVFDYRWYIPDKNEPERYRK